MVKIRLSRTGKKNYANYKLVVTNAREKRDSNVIEYVGYFNPHTKELKLEQERIKYWLGVGAQPSESVAGMLVKNGLMDKPAFSKKFAGKPGKKAQARTKTEN
ncbi:30S ribosomal protein S16 [Patescibacteria group bacterium]|nr:30S ribosomal protein S16 [Patescibacteria group bacterium]